MQLRKLEPNEGLRVFDINWKTDTAGPSPNANNRIEVFLLGCNKAMEGNPCKGCFNSVTWDSSIAQWSYDPIEFADMINSECKEDEKYITIGGGEPTDQIKKLIPFVKRLKEHGFHIMMYTWRDLAIELCPFSSYVPLDVPRPKYMPIRPSAHMKILLRYIDMVVDGEFKQEECLYQQELGDGMLSSIGSGNQCVWDMKGTRESNSISYIRYPMKDLVGLYVKPDTKDLVYITKDKEE